MGDERKLCRVLSQACKRLNVLSLFSGVGGLELGLSSPYPQVSATAGLGMSRMCCSTQDVQGYGLRLSPNLFASQLRWNCDALPFELQGRVVPRMSAGSESPYQRRVLGSCPGVLRCGSLQTIAVCPRFL